LERLSQPFEIVDGGANVVGDPDSVSFDVVVLKGRLHVTEETPCPGYGYGHRAKFAQDTLPLL
jgi:hypothetical protein